MASVLNKIKESVQDKSTEQEQYTNAPTAPQTGVPGNPVVSIP